MNKEKIKTLTKYLESIKSRMSDAVPPKHAKRVEQYKAFLSKEYQATLNKIEALKL